MLNFEYKRDLLESFGFVVGRRDPNMNRAFEGEFMVAEGYEPGTVQDDAQGGDGVWCIVGDDIQSLVDEAISFFEMEGPELLDWQDIRQPSARYVISTKPDGINVTFEDGEYVWIERENGRIRVHCYRPGQDEPMNVEIHKDRIEAWTDAR